jgi:hypothetical protein
MTIFLSLLACAPSSPWSTVDVMAPHRARLDTDGDGRVAEDEYTRTLWKGPAFAAVDTDRDGDLSTTELLVVFYGQPATDFDGRQEADALPGRPMPELAAGQRDVWEVLTLMGDALVASGEMGLDRRAVSAAVSSGRMDSLETRLVLGVLRDRWGAHGWVWPEGLP